MDSFTRFTGMIKCKLVLSLSDVTGTKVEGILRQSADVEEVDQRVQAYETGQYVQFYCLTWKS